MQVFRVPKASENMEFATVGRWLKERGDAVKSGDPLVDILTEKADFTIDASEAGFLAARFATEKSVVPVGYVLGVVGAAGETAPDFGPENERIMREAGPRSVPAAAVAAPLPSRPPGLGVLATPAARRAAKAADVSLESVHAALGLTGPVTDDAVRRFLESGNQVKGRSAD